METDKKLAPSEKRRLKIFLLVAFGFTFLMGIPLGVAQRNGLAIDLFPNAQMFYPAAGVMLASLICGRDADSGDERQARIPRRFFLFFIVLTALMAACCIASLFLPQLPWSLLIQFVIIGGSVLSWVFLLTEKKEKREAWGLRWAGHMPGRSILILLLFLFLYLLRTFASVGISGQLGEYLLYWRSYVPYINMLVLLPNFFLVFTAFFGEEYGWRYYLQPLLQKRFGLIRGTLLLGVIWGLWHLPLDIFFYTTPAYALQSIVSHQITCITLGVFFAFAYMSTGNIWLPVLLHFFNNNMILVISGTADISGQVIGWADVLAALIINGVVFLPFLAAKVFRRGGQPLPESGIAAQEPEETPDVAAPQ